MTAATREIYFIIFFIGAFALSNLLTRAVRKIAEHYDIADYPDLPRKIHETPRPKLGGLAVFFTFVIGVVLLAAAAGISEVSAAKIVGVVLGGLILVIGGILDDKYDLHAKHQIWFPVAASLLVVLSGTHISYITSPFGGDIILDQYKIGGYPLFGSLLVFAWILGLTYTTKFLDGMDGLTTGISAIAGLVIFGVSLSPEVNQTTTALLALIFAGAALGFLPFNFFPAKIFLGEGGSTFTGFLIAALAVISGAKIATALLVLGIPVLDAAWVIVQRLLSKGSPFRGDNKHLHYRLLDIGLTQRQAVALLYFLSAVFGFVAVFLQSLGKLVALGILSAVMVVVVIAVAAIYRKKRAL